MLYPPISTYRTFILTWAVASACAASAYSDEAATAARAQVHVAVASNFAGPLEQLAKAFAKTGGGAVKSSAGSTGKLYAQIKNGGPFEVFLSADAAHVDRLIKDGLTDDTTRFTYAIGRLALYAPGIAPVSEATLRDPAIKHLAIANPETAPYGAAAREVLNKLQLKDAFSGRTVFGENIAQTLQFVESGGAEAGFVAYAQVNKRETKTYWLVPENLHTPILQDACLLREGEKNRTAHAFMDFLKTNEARKIIVSFGYAIVSPNEAKR
ncbi:MAG: molybdate ABC transporter substrate-binding protein [Candidatus Hydrogenedentes bacterium]|nr:molybdate ABC transporter substrate-binding protein [Candidatus Hydrogenedentota bacterium]